MDMIFTVLVLAAMVALVATDGGVADKSDK
jgi:hypothetical protein